MGDVRASRMVRGGANFPTGSRTLPQWLAAIIDLDQGRESPGDRPGLSMPAIGAQTLTVR